MAATVHSTPARALRASAGRERPGRTALLVDRVVAVGLWIATCLVALSSVQSVAASGFVTARCGGGACPTTLGVLAYGVYWSALALGLVLGSVGPVFARRVSAWIWPWPFVSLCLVAAGWFGGTALAVLAAR